MSNQPRMKGVVDIAFLIDATGSMQPCIDALKASIGLFIDTLTTPGPNSAPPVQDWRAKVVAYRDFEETGSPAFEDHPFVRDAEALKAQLAQLKTEGGGDEPESLLDAVYQLFSGGLPAAGDTEDQGKWRRGVKRFLIVFTDASFKPRMVGGGGWNDVQNLLMSNRIYVNLFAPDLDQYNETFAAIDKSEYYAIPVPTGTSPQRALAEYVGDQAVFNKTLQQIAASVSCSAAVEETVLL